MQSANQSQFWSRDRRDPGGSLTAITFAGAGACLRLVTSNGSTSSKVKRDDVRGLPPGVPSGDDPGLYETLKERKHAPGAKGAGACRARSGADAYRQPTTGGARSAIASSSSSPASKSQRLRPHRRAARHAGEQHAARALRAGGLQHHSSQASMSASDGGAPSSQRNMCWVCAGSGTAPRARVRIARHLPPGSRPHAVDALDRLDAAAIHLADHTSPPASPSRRCAFLHAAPARAGCRW